MHIGGEGRIRTYGPVAQTAAFWESRFDSATLAPLPELDFSAELTLSLLELGISRAWHLPFCFFRKIASRSLKRRIADKRNNRSEMHRGLLSSIKKSMHTQSMCQGENIEESKGF
jgi:hypothetical protein